MDAASREEQVSRSDGVAPLFGGAWPPDAWTPEMLDWIAGQARDAGFDVAGVAPVRSPADATDAERFSEWVKAGYAGEMEYLKRSNEEGVYLRSGVEVAVPWARSVVVCAFNYNAEAPRSINPAPADTGWIARYAWSGREAANAAEDGKRGLLPADYHDELLSRLRRVESALVALTGCESRCYVDTGPLVERTAAARAGVGWVGKNTCVINQGLGSWLLLAVVITSIPVEAGVEISPAADRCGSCTRCMDACPTNALIAPRRMDASRCISYLTIEKKGEIEEELRPLMGRNVFGCDICQEVCPWNRRAPVKPRAGMLPRAELVNPALEWLASLDEAAFRRAFKGSPLERTRRKRLHRNVAIAMANSGDRRFLPQLDRWSAAEDAVLASTAEWAARRIRSGVLSATEDDRPME